MTTTSAPRHASPRLRSIGVLAALLVLCVGGGALIGVAFAGQEGTYQALDLPAWAPPTGVFGPVWTVLYTLMAVSAWLVWRSDHPLRGRALVAFGVQLAFNFAWTPVFFGADARLLGLGVIVGVALTAGWWVTETWRIHRVAGVLQLGYLAWLTFATALNAAIAVAN